MWELIVVVAVVLGGVYLYSSLVKLREQAEAAWADLDVQLQAQIRPDPQRRGDPEGLYAP